MIPIEIRTAAGTRSVDLAAYLVAEAEERAHDAEYAWIKALRHARVDGATLRQRWTVRGDSLWWFAELYLHKTQAILAVVRLIAAFDAMVERERPSAVKSHDATRGWLLQRLAAARRIGYDGPARQPSTLTPLARMDARASGLHAAATLGRIGRGAPAQPRARVAAFIHRAFWRGESADGSAESYIGPVLRQLETMTDDAVRYVALGPQSNFRARRWWDPLAAGRLPAAVLPIEDYAPLSALQASRRLWRERHAVRRALWRSEDVRDLAVIGGVDSWPIVREQLAGVALLQFPWSARVMDEAGAALDRLAPSVALTYAEAGGWGRALALECRRRSVPLVGLQHGFIYRHWLNYRHEADEMQPDGGNPRDRGFPLPARTLVFDRRTAEYLEAAGRFPPGSVEVTGSPRLDELAHEVRRLDTGAIDAVRRAAGAAPDDALVVVATKQREAAAVLPQFLDAVRGLPAVRIAIKPHPAEVPGVYASAVQGIPNAAVLPAGAPLPALLAAARALVTVNSTVAVDALALGVPSLVIGLPNNLSPFVTAGAMAGAARPDEMRPALERVLYDQEFRRKLLDAAVGLAARPTGDAAVRTAVAVLAAGERRN